MGSKARVPRLILGLLNCLLLIAGTGEMQARTWQREYVYHADEADTESSAREMAILRIKQALLEEICVYVQGETASVSTSDGELVREISSKRVRAITAGILHTRISYEHWDGAAYVVRAEISADEKDVLSQIAAVLEDGKRLRQLETSYEAQQYLLDELERLKESVARASQQDKAWLRDQYLRKFSHLGAEDWLIKGRTAHADGDLTNAELCYLNALSLKPDLALAHTELGRLYYDMEDSPGAIECFSKAVVLDPADQVPLVNLGAILYQQNRYQEAAVYLESALRISPEDVNARYYLGLVLDSGMDQSGALEQFRQVVARDSLHAKAYYHLGNIQSRMGDAEAAIRSFDKAISLDPSYAPAHLSLAITLGREGDLAASAACFEEAIRLKPDNAEACFLLGGVYLKLEDMDKGIEWVKQAARLGHKESRDILKQSGLSW